MSSLQSTTNLPTSPRRWAALAACLIACPLWIGCGGGAPTSDLDALAEQMDSQSAPADDLDALAEQNDVQSAAEVAKENLETLKQAAETARAAADGLANEGPTELTIEDMKRGKKITSVDPLSTPIRAGIRAEQKLSMYAWQQSLQIYAATHDFDYPESHEAFMTEIIEANGIKLETLLEPYEYWYSTEEETLRKRVKPSAIETAEQEAQTAEAAYAAAQNE